MGAPYNQNICQWSNGGYVNANQFQDDLVVIGSSAGRRADDHSPDFAYATPLTIGAGGAVSNSGVIASPDDVDAFVFVTGGGTVNLQFNGAPNSPNLDIEAKLYNAGGTLVATASPANQLSASLSANGLAAGTYYLTVDGVGNGTWASSGYDDYGSLGEYTISGNVPSSGWRFQIPVNALNGATVGTVAPGGSGYSITGGNTNSAFSIHATTGVLSVANASSLATLGSYSLTIAYTSGSPQVASVQVGVAPLRGLKQQIWTGLGGNGIAGLTSSSNYPNSPNLTRYSPIIQACYPADNFGQKLSGYLLPKETGSHTFWITADDAGEVWLSTDANPSNKTRIAFSNSATDPDAWTAQGSQQSAAVNLVAGQRYYIEVLQRDHGGRDHLGVSWQTPTLGRRLIATE